jgi:hypothetical protein
MADSLRFEMTREEFEQRLNERNEATRVWIQSETQARARIVELEKEIERLKALLDAAVALHIRIQERLGKGPV